ncbi:hypothetical protein MKK58_17630 [Methylobacterium sp. J-078]|uniref:hypothetical protein n=1 Tax=Methylobacterium sp. J-078 TaxID=2836657 RepID=UPI001FBB6D0D|nr:hypothetical protein [Methylobacterium sp. J-078]MCJ2046339.1 hypothetical protein [Methylobacterium sp. J-078]
MTDKLIKSLSKIVICDENRDALNEALKALKGPSKKPFPDAGDVAYWIGHQDPKLADAGVAPTNRIGCTYEYRAPGPSAASYKYRKAVIAFEAKRTSKGWVVTSASTAHVHPQQPMISRISLTPKAKQAVVRAALEPFGTLQSKAA